MASKHRRPVTWVCLRIEQRSYYSAYVLKARRKGGSPLLIAILAPATIEWAATFFAITRMGHASLLLSNRLPDDTDRSFVERRQTAGRLSMSRNLQLGMTVVAVPIVSFRKSW